MTPTSSVVSTSTLTGGPVKLGKVSDHSVCCRVVWRALLMSPRGRELDDFKCQRFKVSYSFTFPHFKLPKINTRAIILYIFTFFRCLVVNLVFGAGNLCCLACHSIYLALKIGFQTLNFHLVVLMNCNCFYLSNLSWDSPNHYFCVCFPV